MNLIKKMFNLNNREKYIFAVYANYGRCGIISLLLLKEGYYYDLFNHVRVEEYVLDYKKQLTDFVPINEEQISVYTAKKLAKPYYDKFFKEFQELYCKDKEILKDDNHTFFQIL